MRHARSASVVIALLLAAAIPAPSLLPGDAHAAVVTSVFNGRVPCVQAGVGQVCSSAGVVNRVESWDGVPLDVTVTIPPAVQNGPFPLIVDLHGFGAGKTTDPEIEALVPQGYVVLIYSARGQHFSCGFPASRATDPTLSNPDVCTERGWFRLGDLRYEVRDTQYLAGRLLDEGLVLPDIGVTGVSFGGGQSLMLAALKNRMMLPNGTLVPWESPNAVPMSVAASAPIIGWSDLSAALVPNGRTLDYRALNPYGARAGIMKKSWNDTLYNVGVATAFYAPLGTDPDADLQAWKARLDQGEPYDTDPLLQHALAELTTYHSAYYVDDSIEPAPLLIYDAFTDDIMPVNQALRFYRKTKSLYPAAQVALQFLDGFAHPRGNLGSPSRPLTYNRVTQHLAFHLKGTGTPVPAVETYTQACNGSAQAGPFTALDWDSIHPGEIRHADAGPKSFTSAAGNATNASADDPIAGGATACHTVSSSADDPAAATYRLPAVACAMYTLMGSPTVIADLAVTGDYAEVAARLWDVAPDNSQSLVTHALYRPRTEGLGPEVFQLEPAGWQFTAGHVAKLELLGQSSPYGRPSNGTFSISVTDLELRLPVLETPGACGVQAPAAPVFPPPESTAIPTPNGTATPNATASPTPAPTTVAQTILGKKLQVKNPTGEVFKRAVRGDAREKASPNVIVGNPTVNGATLRVIANGATDSDQTFNLPAAGWRPIKSIGFKYSNKTVGGAVKRATIKKSANGTFKIQIRIDGKGGALAVVPPNPGDDGGFVLTLTGGPSYCVAFGGAAGGVEQKDDATQWRVKNPTAEGCVQPDP